MKKWLALTATSTLLLSGCVIHIGEDHNEKSERWQLEQSNNHYFINQMSLGTSLADTTAKLGEASDIEAFEQDGATYKILFYRTKHKHADGKTTLDETTPLIFKNGRLTGIGHATYDKLMNQ